MKITFIMASLALFVAACSASTPTIVPTNQSTPTSIRSTTVTPTPIIIAEGLSAVDTSELAMELWKSGFPKGIHPYSTKETKYLNLTYGENTIVVHHYSESGNSALSIWPPILAKFIIVRKVKDIEITVAGHGTYLVKNVPNGTIFQIFWYHILVCYLEIGKEEFKIGCEE